LVLFCGGMAAEERSDLSVVRLQQIDDRSGVRPV
jgi:hypothetical protein